MIDVNGTLYGTTKSGGLSYGTVYGVTASGTHRVLYRFHRSPDGAEPRAGVIDVNGTLYGTTAGGGSANDGTVYSVTTSGTESVLHSFKGGSDGAEPEAALLYVNGTLYGTTFEGGGSGCNSGLGCGTVFSITTTGQELVLHSFAGGSDGALPLAALIDVKGLLYGTTAEGGACASQGGCGTVYTVTPAGAEKVLYAFRGSPDARAPWSGLTDVKGTLYGTTAEGGQGGSDCYGQGCGTVYSVSTKGAETVLHRFADGKDGAQPAAGLTDRNGVLYGTTSSGGEGGSCFEANGNCGTVFGVTTSGVEMVLYRFKGGTDGFSPIVGMVNVNGTLYGTTHNGGDRDKCCHTYGFGTK